MTPKTIAYIQPSWNTEITDYGKQAFLAEIEPQGDRVEKTSAVDAVA
jgi:hypothetical protein